VSARKSYDQGWLDGANAFAAECAAHTAREDRLVAATEALRKAVDSSKRVRALEALLRQWADGWGNTDGHPTALYHATKAALEAK
jgi:hypothetical protein